MSVCLCVYASGFRVLGFVGALGVFFPSKMRLAIEKAFLAFEKAFLAFFGIGLDFGLFGSPSRNYCTPGQL